MAGGGDSIEVRVGKLALGPGDICVLHVRDDMSDADFVAFRQQWDQLVPENRLLLISGDVELSVLTSAEIEARAT